MKKDVKPPPAPLEGTRERILKATLELLLRLGAGKLSMSDVASAAEVSRPTLYRYFPSKEALLHAFTDYERSRFDEGLAAVIDGTRPSRRLDAILQFVVEFQRSYSLRQLVEIEPEHVLQRMTQVLPVIRERLAHHFAGPNAQRVAAILTRSMLSHALMPADDPAEFLEELRAIARIATPSKASRSEP